jgi:hypothetical protein
MVDSTNRRSTALIALSGSVEPRAVAASPPDDEARARVAAHLLEMMRKAGYECKLMRDVCH